MSSVQNDMALLTVSNLTISVGQADKAFTLVDRLSISIASGEVLALVGESGSGKSLTSLAIMGLLAERGPRITGGTVRLDGHDVTQLSPHERVATGAKGTAMVFQDPLSSLNPVLRIGRQVYEAVRVHDKTSDREAWARVVELLTLVRLPDVQHQIQAFPHELSGGMRQRVMIAIALACRPRVLIADEPTTALDVTVQRQILGLIRELCDTTGMSALFITHDLGTVAQLADKVAVMYAGSIVELATTNDLFASPFHPYTVALRNCIPDLRVRGGRLAVIPGMAPRPGEIPQGCSFQPRCRNAGTGCTERRPLLAEVAVGHNASCWHPVGSGVVA